MCYFHCKSFKLRGVKNFAKFCGSKNKIVTPILKFRGWKKKSGYAISRYAVTPLLVTLLRRLLTTLRDKLLRKLHSVTEQRVTSNGVTGKRVTAKNTEGKSLRKRVTAKNIKGKIFEKASNRLKSQRSN